VVEGIPITITIGISFIELGIEGILRPETSARLAGEIRRNAESVTGKTCILA
jgi:hypothetical protein